MRGRLLPVALAVGSVASAAVAVVSGLAGGPPPRPAASLATPVFSVRRAPELVTRVVADRRLAADLTTVLDDPELAGTRTCLAVVGPEGHPVLSRGSGEPLMPASTLKLLTATVALARMGPDATFTTEVRAASGPDGEGVVGDLWLVGGGDPLLATADFAATAGWLDSPRIFTSVERLADDVVAAGARRVGRVLGDEARYDTQRYIASWKESYATAPEVGPQSALIVNGGFVQSRPRAIPAPAPAAHAADVLAGLLAARGVTVGAAGQATAPPGTVTIASAASPPLREVVGVILGDSDNLAAEMLLKELGTRFGDGGTTAEGLEVVRAELARLAPGATGPTLADGSGLDRGNRLTCDLLQTLLLFNGVAGPLAAALPQSGRNGTLVRRFLGTDAEGDVRAKTGSLDGVVGLAGWTAGHDGKPLQFSLLANDLPDASVGPALQEAVAVALARYPKAPAPGDVAPLPPVPAAR